MFMGEYSAVVLNGGESSRISVQNKGLLKLGGITILERIINVLRPKFREILIITNSPGQLGFLKDRCFIFQDEKKGLGPLGGIYTGLKKMKFEVGFFVACDMPFLNPELIDILLKHSTGFDAVCPRCGKFIEPLHAVYTKNCINSIEFFIKREDTKRVRDLLSMVRTCYVDIPAEKFHLGFFNINTREDYERAKFLI